MVSALAQMMMELVTVALIWTVFALVAILIHEVGHAGAGLFCGFEIIGMRVGPIHLKFKQQELLGWAFSRGAFGSGFVQGQFRRVPGKSATWRGIVYIAAGPLINICAGLFLLPFANRIGLLALIAGYLGGVSIFIGAANLIPFQLKSGTQSDGRKLLWLIFSRQKRGELIFLWSVKALSNDFRRFCETSQFDRALERVDELIRGISSRKNHDGDTYLQKLLKVRDELQNSLDSKEKPAVELLAKMQTASVSPGPRNTSA